MRRLDVDELKSIVRLAVPMMVAESGLIVMGLVDTLVLGQVDAAAMGSLSVGNCIIGMFSALGMGIVMAVEPLISQSLGAARYAWARHWFRQGLLTAQLIAVPLCGMAFGVTQLLWLIDVEPQVVHYVETYVLARLPGLLLYFSFIAHRALFSSHQRTRPLVVAIVAANTLNVVLDLVFVFALGLSAVGIGLATSGCWAVMLVIAMVCRRELLEQHGEKHEESDVAMPHGASLRRIFSLGTPIGLQLSADIAIFVVLAALVARLGPTSLAGHQIALAISSTMFMAAVGVALAVTARVGNYMGAEMPRKAFDSGMTGTAFAAGLMAVCGVGLIPTSSIIANAFSPADAAAAALGSELIILAAVMAVADASQVVLGGALRGLGDTRVPAILVLIAMWGLGLPFGILFGLRMERGASGLWMGIIVGMFAAAALLLARLIQLKHRGVARLKQVSA